MDLNLSPDGRFLSYETQFYPSVTTIDRATVIALRSGEERSSINFQLRPVPTVKVSGMVVAPDGQPGNLRRVIMGEPVGTTVRG